MKVGSQSENREKPDPDPIIEKDPDPIIEKDPDPIIEKDPDPIMEKDSDPIIEKDPDPGASKLDSDQTKKKLRTGFITLPVCRL